MILYICRQSAKSKYKNADNCSVSIKGVNIMEINNNSRVITDEEIRGLMLRPSEKRYIKAGIRAGIIGSVEVKELDSSYSLTGKRLALNIKTLVKDEDSEEEVILYFAPNLTWNIKGKMMKTLKGLECVPEPGKALEMDLMVGMRVNVVIENNEKDGIKYSNIITMTKDKESNTLGNKDRKVSPRKYVSKEEDLEDFDI